jgi:DNA-binding NarL/FixJ family response regulator
MPQSTESEQIRLRVLIVDSHEVSRAAVRALLQTEGVEVLADVSSAADALALENASPDVAIIDVSQDVSEALACAGALSHLSSLPTVVLTASTPPGGDLDGHIFIAKSDLSAQTLRALH